MHERYLPTHEWARAEGEEVVIGLSDFAAREVGDVVHVGLPKVGAELRRGVACAEIESVKSVHDFYSPLDGTVTAVNDQLAQRPELVNQEPLGAGWFVRVRPACASWAEGLLTAEQYRAQLGLP
ncbi:MAG: glycine cleavage system protein GcvH [Planctomycetes bacterium]|nr:glycine cleavage system protein GcvH [Planctomycetota bacterium]